MTSKRDQLSQWTTLVADTGDLDAIRSSQPVDATTNPSLLLSVAKQPQHQHLLMTAKRFAGQLSPSHDIGLLCDAFATVTGSEILNSIPGLISTEVDARLSFDTNAMVTRARRLVAMYRELGVERDRILVKIASTWEGIRATEVLEEEGIRCNLTLLFALPQAIAAAEAGATLISPFVGRIYDWHLKHGLEITGPDNDPGVQSVKDIFHTLKSRGFGTVVMGASFRQLWQIEALAGCDKLTIAPNLLDALAADNGTLSRALDGTDIEDIGTVAPINEQSFRWQMNDDPMACDLLADGIRRFARDQETLEGLLGAI
ncbi:MAG: transaldolase [Gammaproteobacteria bacterium HGW-Gammaproteobacteria-14]|nr:MAG: transaldolase [Gammaproteobacteria bacterium HGW-Gammaproteobacteria-14]